MNHSSNGARRALITGAASGFGAELARRLSADGWRLALTDQNATRVQAVAEALDGDHWSQGLDVTDQADWDSAYQRVMTEWGGLDLLVNNAGVAVGGNLADTPLTDWQWVLDIDLFGVVRGCHRFVPLFQEQGAGAIVNVASFAGIAGAPQIAAYGTAKAGVIALSEFLRAEMHPHGVHVSVVCPAFVQTNLTDTMRAPDAGYQSRVRRWMENSGVTAGDVAEAIIKGVEERQFMILTHQETRWAWRIKRWFPEYYFRTMLKRVSGGKRR